MKYFYHHLYISEPILDPEGWAVSIVSIQFEPSAGTEKSGEHHENDKTQYLSLSSFSTTILKWELERKDE